MRASSTLLLQCMKCVSCLVCVAVFDRDQLTCIKLLWLDRKFRFVLLVVRVDPNLFPTLPWRRFRAPDEC